MPPDAARWTPFALVPTGTNTSATACEKSTDSPGPESNVNVNDVWGTHEGSVPHDMFETSRASEASSADGLICSQG